MVCASRMWGARSALALAGLAGAAVGREIRTSSKMMEDNAYLAPQLQEELPQLAWETGTWVVCERGRLSQSAMSR